MSGNIDTMRAKQRITMTSPPITPIQRNVSQKSPADDVENGTDTYFRPYVTTSSVSSLEANFDRLERVRSPSTADASVWWEIPSPTESARRALEKVYSNQTGPSLTDTEAAFVQAIDENTVTRAALQYLLPALKASDPVGAAVDRIYELRHAPTYMHPEKRKIVRPGLAKAMAEIARLIRLAPQEQPPPSEAPIAMTTHSGEPQVKT